MRQTRISSPRLVKRMGMATLLGAAMLPLVANAYVGPGAGISLLGALWGLIVGVVLAIGMVLAWPVRILLRKRQARREGGQPAAMQEDKVDTAANEPAEDESPSA